MNRYYPSLRSFLLEAKKNVESEDISSTAITKIEDQKTVISPITKKTIDMELLKREMESAKLAIVSQSPLFAPYVHKFIPIYTWVIPTMATDGIRLFVNPEFADNLEWEQKIFVIIHEIMHCVLMHMKRKGSRDHSLFNQAADHEINPIIVDTIPRSFDKDFIKKIGALYNEKYLHLPVEEIYEDLLKNPPKNNAKDSNGKGSGGDGQGNPTQGNFPGDVGSAISPQEGVKIAKQSGYADNEIGDIDEDENSISDKWKVEATKMLKTASDLKKAGKGQGDSLINTLYKLTRGEVNWKSVLKRFVGDALSPETEPRIGNKRFLRGEFLRMGEKEMHEAISNIFVCVDTSGSMSREVLTRILSEINEIIFSKQANKVTVLYFDDGVFEKGIQVLGRTGKPFIPKVPGGGGTDFQKTLDFIKTKYKDNVALCLFFTDGGAPMPKMPKYYRKFIWMVYGDKDFQQPFGRKILLD